MKIGFYLLQKMTEGIISLSENIIENVSDKLAKLVIKKIDSIKVE